MGFNNGLAQSRGFLEEGGNTTTNEMPDVCPVSRFSSLGTNGYLGYPSDFLGLNRNDPGGTFSLLLPSVRFYFPQFSPATHYPPYPPTPIYPSVLANSTRFFRCGYDTCYEDRLKTKDQGAKCQIGDGLICPISTLSLQSFLGINSYHAGICKFLSATANSSDIEPLRLIAFGGSVTAGADANGCCCTSSLDRHRCPLSSQNACGNSCSGGKSDGNNLLWFTWCHLVTRSFFFF